MGFRNVAEAGIRCDFLKDALYKAGNTARDNTGSVHPHIGAKGAGTCQEPCAGAIEFGCPVWVKVTYEGKKVTIENPYGKGTVTGFDKVDGKQRIEVTTGVQCVFGEEVGN